MEIKTSDKLLDRSITHSISMGDSGKGKSYFIGTICDHGNPFVVDTEGGLLTIADKTFDYVSINSFQEFSEAFTWYMANWEKKGYTHFVVDSFTRLQHYLMREINPEGKLTMNEWGEVLARLRKTIDVLTKLCPTSTHVSAMATESKDELTGQIKIYPNLQGSFRYDLAGYFDFVFYHDCGEKNGQQQYWIQAQGDQRVTARSRGPKGLQLEKIITNDYANIVNFMNRLTSKEN